MEYNGKLSSDELKDWKALDKANRDCQFLWVNSKTDEVENQKLFTSLGFNTYSLASADHFEQLIHGCLGMKSCHKCN